MERVITQSRKQLQTISEKATAYLNQAIKADVQAHQVKHREDGRYVTAMVETNDFVMLVPVAAGAVNFGYLAILSTESMAESDEPSNYMRVHSI